MGFQGRHWEVAGSGLMIESFRFSDIFSLYFFRLVSGKISLNPPWFTTRVNRCILTSPENRVCLGTVDKNGKDRRGPICSLCSPTFGPKLDAPRVSVDLRRDESVRHQW